MAFGTLKATFVDTGTSIIPIEQLRSVTDLHPVAFSGSYTALLNRPVLGTAAALNAATALTAGPTEVVLGSDPRLNDSRQPVVHTHTSTAITDFTESAALAAPVQSVAGRTGNITLSASDISGLAPAAFSGSYTDLLNKPTLGTAAALNASDLRDRATHTGTQAISSITGLQVALDGKQPTGSYATLDQSGKVPASQLPSYVDDVLEVANVADLPATGETDKIYTTRNDNRIYRWSGSTYIEISPSPGSTDAVPEGSVNLYFTSARAALAAPVQSVAGRSGNVTLTANDISGLATVATSGQYADLGGKPPLLALTQSQPLSLATSAATGVSTDAARADHIHALPSLPDLGITTGTQTLTVAVAPNAIVEVALTASQVFILHSVTISSAAWVVLYNSTSAAIADTERSQTTDPTTGSGVVAEFITEGTTTLNLSPTATIVSGESPASTSYPVKVKNLGATSSVVVTFNFYKLG